MKQSKNRTNNILFIDTSNNQEVVIKVISGKEEIIMKHEMNRTKVQAVLPLMEEALEKKSIKLEELTGIEVITGPGSFTGLRVGVAIANTLATVLKIPVNQKENGVLVEPSY